MEPVFKTFPTKRLKFIPHPVPAHWRYWAFVGLATWTRQPITRVQVYGVQEPGFVIPVGLRRAD